MTALPAAGRVARAMPALPLALRVPVFSAGGMWLGVTAHVAAGGPRPGWGTIALVTLAVALLGTVLGRHERGLATMIAGVGSTQLLMHELLTAGHPTMPGAHGGRWMTVGHLAATLVMAAWMWRGEAAAWSAARRAADSLRRWSRPGPPATPNWRTPQPPPVSSRPLQPVGLEVRTCRGPPVSQSALAACRRP